MLLPWIRSKMSQKQSHVSLWRYHYFPSPWSFETILFLIVHSIVNISQRHSWIGLRPPVATEPKINQETVFDYMRNRPIGSYIESLKKTYQLHNRFQCSNNIYVKPAAFHLDTRPSIKLSSRKIGLKRDRKWLVRYWQQLNNITSTWIQVLRLARL